MRSLEVKQIDDAQMLKYIKCQIAKFASLSKISKEFRGFTKSTKISRSSSVSTNLHYTTSYHTEEAEKFKYHLPLSIYGKNVDLCETVEVAFEKIMDQYSGTTWCKLEKKPLIHVAAIKQFWFDCYLSDCCMLGLLIDSLPSKVWVTIEGFYKSIEAAQRVSAYNVFSMKRYDKKSQKSFLIQKLLCKIYLVFFCFIQYEVGALLNKDSLFKVLVLANKKEKTQVQMWVDFYFAKANDSGRTRKNHISFEEFCSIAIKSFDL